MIDKKITMTNGVYDLTYEYVDSLQNNIFFSIMIPYNTIVPNFGCRLNEIKKPTVENLALAQQYVEQALQWIIDIDRAQSIEVIVELDEMKQTRANILIIVSRGTETLRYDIFYDIV